MSDLAATNCGNGCERNDCCSIIWIIILLSLFCGNNGSMFSNNDDRCGCGNNSCIWIILLLLFCGNGSSIFSGNGCGCNFGCGC